MKPKRSLRTTDIQQLVILVHHRKWPFEAGQLAIQFQVFGLLTGQFVSEDEMMDRGRIRAAGRERSFYGLLQSNMTALGFVNLRRTRTREQ